MSHSKNIVITGASRGFGAHLARRLSSEGARLLLVARSAELLDKLNDELGPDVATLVADVSEAGSADEILHRARESWTQVDVLINNAGIQGPIGPAWENDAEAWAHTIAVNLTAPVNLCRAFVPWMLETGAGRIINLSGGGGTTPRPNFSAYAAAKAGLVRFSETLAEELRGHEITVNCVAPGAMASDMLREIVDAGPKVSGGDEHAKAVSAFENGDSLPTAALDLVAYLALEAPRALTGKLISAIWDPWRDFAGREVDLATDIYTLRRIVPNDRGMSWGES
jgi:3-oxoacyl-[acyl-carrier protein] reductase